MQPSLHGDSPDSQGQLADLAASESFSEFVQRHHWRRNGRPPRELVESGETRIDLGAVKFDGTGAGSIAVIDGSTFNSWDGRRLSLMDGRTLSPVKK